MTVNGKSVTKISSNGDGRSLGWYHGNGTGLRLFEGTLLVVGAGELSAAAEVSVQVHIASLAVRRGSALWMSGVIDNR